MKRLIITGIIITAMVLLAGCSNEKGFNKQISKDTKLIYEAVENKYKASLGLKSPGYDYVGTVNFTSKAKEEIGISEIKVEANIDSSKDKSKIDITSSADSKKLINATITRIDGQSTLGLKDDTDKGLIINSEANVPDLLDTGGVASVLQKYCQTVLGGFKYNSMEKDSSIDVVNVHFKAKKYTAICDINSFNSYVTTANSEFSNSNLGKYIEAAMKYFNGNTEDMNILGGIATDGANITLNIYVGKQYNRAYEFVNDKGDIAGFITNGSNWSLYTVKGGVTQEIASYSIDSTNGTGEMHLGVSGTNINIGCTNVTMSDTGIMYCDFEIYGESKGQSRQLCIGKYKRDGGQIDINASINRNGEEFATISITGKERDFRDFTNNIEGIDYNAWISSIDLKGIKERFNWLSKIIGTESIEDISDETVVNTEDNNDMSEQDKQDMLKKLKGYKKEYNEVYFNPDKEEVKKVGEPSTAINVMAVDEYKVEQAEKTITEMEFIKDFQHDTEETYEVYGEDNNVESYYKITDKYEKDADNYLVVVHEAVTGKLSAIYISSNSLEKTCEVAQKIFNELTGYSGITLLEKYNKWGAKIVSPDGKVSAKLIGDKNYDETEYFAVTIE